MRIRELIEYGEKSKIKAGDAVPNGKYPLFTSSEAEDKRYDQYTCDTEGIIMGTGGNATLHYYNGKFAVSTDCLVLKPNKNIKCKYLYYFFKANMNILQAGFKGAGLKHTNKNYIENIELNRLPDIKQQLEIICKLDKIETIIKKHQKLIEKLDMLIKSQFIELFGDPIHNDKHWEKKKLSEECSIITGNTPSRSKPEYYGDYIEWIKSDNINTPNIFLTQANEYLSEDGMKIGRTVEDGAILMTCIAGSLSCIGNVAITDRKVSFNQQINAIIPNNNNSYFLYVLFELTKQELQNSVDMMLKGIVSKSKLEAQEYIFPPVKLQNEYGYFVKECDKLKFIAQKSLNKTQMLFDSLMQKYFG